MTIEEYFDNEIKKAEMENYDIFNSTEFAYHHLTIKLLKMLKEEILKVDREVTLREFVESCKKDRENLCPECPWKEMCFRNDDWYLSGGYAFCELDVDEIQKKVKEMKNDD